MKINRKTAALALALTAALTLSPRPAAAREGDGNLSIQELYERHQAEKAEKARLAEEAKSQQAPKEQKTQKAKKIEGESVTSEDAELIRSANDNWLDLARRHPAADGKKLDIASADALTAEALAEWWNAFDDKELSRLIGRAFERNQDLRAARARVDQARAQLGVSKAALLPWLDGSASWTNADTSENGTSGGNSYDLYRLGIDASWELDLFGKQRDRVSASAASLESQYASLHDAWVRLSAETAMNYISLRTLQTRLFVANRNAAIQQDTLDMLESKYAVGLQDELAVKQAQYALEQTKAAIPAIEQAIEQTLNALAILTGDIPGALNADLVEARDIPQADSVSLVGIPAEAVRQRPDVRAAERRWISQISTRKAAKKDLLPTISLVGSIGLESFSTGSLFESDSFGFSVGPRITLPIFHGGAIRKNIRVQSALEEQYLAAFEQSVLNAVAEVRNALTANAQEAIRRRTLESGLQAAEAALEIARDKYRQGLSDFNNVLSAMQALYALENDCAVSRGQQMTNLIMLFKALGGGWQPMYEEDGNN